MLEKIKPREQKGRDTFGRYRAQVRSAAIATLSILDGKSADQVYCDLYDDFVVRLRSNGQYFYVFYQVKTKDKKNYNWTLNDIFGLNTRIRDQEKQSSDKVKNSFAGKLLMHTVNFGDQCRAVIFQTNVHTDDNIDNLIADIKKGDFTDKYTNVLIDLFNGCFTAGKKECTEEDIKKNLSKLNFETDIQYLKGEGIDFEPIARDKIYEYSEIDLQHDEAKEILIKLVELVGRKSSGIITEYTTESIEEAAGIKIDDLLGILSISKEAYRSLVQGGDRKAIKSASIIQRALSSSGANIELINYCSKCKTDWDTWIRKNRHILPEIDIYTIITKVNDLLSSNSVGGVIDIGSLRSNIIRLLEDLKAENLIFDLNENLILGAIFSELIREYS